MRPIREYPAPYTRDWKSADRIQAEIELMRRAYKKQHGKPDYRFPSEFVLGVFIAVFCLTLGAFFFFTN